MKKPSTPLEIRLFGALTRIATYDPPATLHKVARDGYGIEPEEAIEMAYENVLAEAKAAIKGVRVKLVHPRTTPPNQAGGRDGG